MTDQEAIPPARALVPTVEKTVDFYGDPIPVAQAGPGVLYVPLRPLSTFLGLSVSGARQRVMRDRVLAPRARQVRMTGADGKRYVTLCLPLDLIPGWLFGIDTTRVKSELQDKLDRYRAECFRVLWDAFAMDTTAPPAPAPGKSGAALAVEIAGAVYALAQQQLDMETRLDQVAGHVADVAGRQEVMAEYLRGFIQRTEGRLITLELQESSGATITEAQAAEIALAVKNVGQALAARGERTGYARVYSEMYRRYRISSYKNLPAARYQHVLDWLAGWYSDLQGAGGPSIP